MKTTSETAIVPAILSGTIGLAGFPFGYA